MLVSLIVIALLVATTVPPVLPVLMLTVNVSAPSVVLSEVGVTVNEPALLLTTNEPLDVPKSPALVTVQYRVVESATLVVLTLMVPALPSLMLVGIVPNAYAATGARPPVVRSEVLVIADGTGLTIASTLL